MLSTLDFWTIDLRQTSPQQSSVTPGVIPLGSIVTDANCLGWSQLKRGSFMSERVKNYCKIVIRIINHHPPIHPSILAHRPASGPLQGSHTRVLGLWEEVSCHWLHSWPWQDLLATMCKGALKHHMDVNKVVTATLRKKNKKKPSNHIKERCISALARSLAACGRVREAMRGRRFRPEITDSITQPHVTVMNMDTPQPGSLRCSWQLTCQQHSTTEMD